MIPTRCAFAALGSLVCLALIVPACSDSESVSSDPGIGADSAAGGSAGMDASTMCTLGSGQALCQLCVNSRCLPECRDCELNQKCDPALGCLKSKCSAECGAASDASAGGSGGQAAQGGAAGKGGGGGKAGAAGKAGSSGQAGSAGKAGSGGSQDAGSDATAGCSINFGIPACNGCINDKCLDSCNSCASNADCVPLLTCVRQCKGDFLCETQCRLKFAGGVGPEELLWGTFGCKKQNCATECAGPPQCGLQTTTTECDSCINGQCFGECDTCANDAECSAIFNCVKKNCSPPYQKWCVEICSLQHPNGGQNMGAFWGTLMTPGCVESKCDAQCLKGILPSKCALNTGAIVCDTCIDAQCMTECDACKGNAECVAIYDCVKAQCTYPFQDPICISSCTVQHLAGATDFLTFWNGLTGCMGTKCGVLCQ